LTNRYDSIIMRRVRLSIFVCSSFNANQLISHTVEASSMDDAASIFAEKYRVKAQSIHGPFRHKKIKADSIDNAINMQFAGQTKTAIYNGWLVSALLLKMPENSAYLLFDRRVDGKKLSKPTRNVIVKLDDLQIC
jgi:hypothetical protein